MLKQRDRQTAVMRALYARLTEGNPPVREAGSMRADLWNDKAQAFAAGNVPVFQAVPKDLTPPFLAFQDLDGTPWGTKTVPGDDFNVNFLVISNYPGYKELANIAHALLVKLTSGALDLSPDGLRVVMLRPGVQVTAPLSDGRTTTRKIPIRIIVEDLAAQVPQAGG